MDPYKPAKIVKEALERAVVDEDAGEVVKQIMTLLGGHRVWDHFAPSSTAGRER